MKILQEEVAKLFDEFREQVTKAWVTEIKEAKSEKRSPELATIMDRLPTTPFSKFTKLFNEAEERIEYKHKNNTQGKKGLFGR